MINKNIKKIQILKNIEPTFAVFFANFNNENINVGKQNIKFLEKYPSNLKFNKKNVILIICDALRSDFVTIKNKKNIKTPFIDSLLQTNNFIKVNNFFSTSSNSYKGISNILTSSYELSYKNFFIYDLLFKTGI